MTDSLEAITVAGLRIRSFVFSLALLCVAIGGAARAEEVWRDTGASPEARALDLVARLTLDEKIGLLTYSAQAIPRLGIQLYYHGNEALHGIVRPGKFTVFPQAIALAATWNPDLIQAMTTAASDEARARNNEMGRVIDLKSSGLLSFWSPTVNMARDPRWGRTPETYGEDPFLTSRIGVAFVKGLQGGDPRYIKVVSTPKHFAVNNEEHNRDRCDVKVSERDLRDYYLRPYKAAVQEANAQSIMGAYNGLNGVPCNANPWLLNTVLRDEWGFDGYVVTDCGALSNLISAHRFVNSGPEAAAVAINAGVDLECGGAEIFVKHLGKAVEMGLVTEETVTQAAYRVLRGRFRLGFFDPVEMVPYNSLSADLIGSKEHQELARRIARESMVLLKNSRAGSAPLLPLDAGAIKSVAVVGPNAGEARFGDYSGTPVHPAVSPVDGIRNKLAGRAEVKFVEWTPLPQQDYQLMPSSAFKNGAERGLKAEYFDNPKFEGAAQTVRTDAGVDVDTQNKPPDPAVPGGRFAARWTGKLVPAASGEHKLSLNTDGRVRLLIDGKTIMQRDAKERPKFSSGKTMDVYAAQQYQNMRMEAPVTLEAGREYEIVLEYAHRDGNALCRLEWIPPAGDLAAARANEMQAARDSNIVIAVMGIGLEHEREGKDRDNLDLPFGQTDYVKQLLEANPNTIVVLVGGSSLAVNWIDEHAPAVLEAWYPGEQGGNAIADVLFGDYNPAGRLPLTFYKSMSDLPAFDDYDITNNRTYLYFTGDPLYPFGHGLSYTGFEYSNLKAENRGDRLAITLDIANTGARDGDEVAQIYISQKTDGDRKVPIKQLSAFKRVHLKKGEKRSVSMEVDFETLKLWNEDSKAAELMAHSLEVQAGASSADIRLRQTVELKK
jgi:beta-glucosidase